MEIRTLLNCVENLRKQLIEGQDIDVSKKYARHDELMEQYKNTAQTIERLKRERTVEVQKDVFDLAMKKISTQAELDMVDIELR